MSKKSKVKNLISGFVTDSPNNCNLGEIHSVYKNALKESDAAAQRYLNIAGTILVAIDKDGKITLLNKKGYKLLGYKEGSLLGKNWFKIALPKSEQKKVRVMFSKIMAGKIKPFESYENSVIAKNGEKKIIFWTNSLLRDDGGKIIGTLSSGEDITVRKDAEAERKKLDLIKDDLIAIASHELKTPITSLVILVGTLKEKQIGELNPKQKEIVDLMLADTNRIQNLVSNMLDIARLEAGHMQYNFKRADIFEVIKKSLLSTTAMAKENGMKITVKGNGPILVKMDRMRIGQVVINLVSNAIKYSKSPGKIVISVSKKGKVLVVSIKDYGKGISKDKLDNLFTRKFQFESAKEHVAGGAGFGLYIARSIIEAHKGKIWVESKSGKGSTFIFSIPLSGGKK